MNLIDVALNQAGPFAQLVRELRELGVTRLTADSIELGELPRAVPSGEARQPDGRSEAERRRDVLFAATRFRPDLPEATPTTANVPRAIVTRRERSGARHGGQGSEG